MFRPLWRAARYVLSLVLVPTLIMRPAFGGTVILHHHGPHEVHAHAVSHSQLEDWCDEHQHWHHRQESGGQDSPEMPTRTDHTTDSSIDDVFHGTVVFVHSPLIVRQVCRLVLPWHNGPPLCTKAGVGWATTGQSLERHYLFNDTSQPFPAGISATTALLLRSHALLI